MLVLTVILRHGVIRAGSADDIAMTGGADPGEWPPSPARIVAALVAADGTRDRCRHTSGSELLLFENADPPRILACPREDVLASRLQPRFVVLNEQQDGAVQEYPGRKATVVRPGTRLCPRDGRIDYVWDEVDPSEGDMAALAARAARIGYIGCADSPATVRVSRRLDEARSGISVWQPAKDGDVELPVSFPGFVDVLNRAFDLWTAGGARRAWFRADRHRYQSPKSDALETPGVEPAWLPPIWVRFQPSLPSRIALEVSQALKAAVLDLYQRHVVPSGEVPWQLHGHVPPGEDTQYLLAQWLPLLDVGGEHSTGHIHGAAVMLPRAAGSQLAQGVREAVWRLRQLTIAGRASIATSLHDGSRFPWAANPKRWLGPSSRWASVLPVVHERRRRHGPSIDDVGEWCRHAGFPAPIGMRVSSVPLLHGSPHLLPSEVFRDRAGTRRPYSHLEIQFDREVTGPMAIGRARQFGMGLMAPRAGSLDG